MKMKSKYFSFLFLFFLYQNLNTSEAQPRIDGYKCTASNQTNTTAGAGTYPCRTYVLYRAQSPNFLDLASIGDLFSMSRLTIANPSNISTVNSTLAQNQPLLIPIDCSCNFINSSFGSISYAGLNYTFKSGDTFWKVSTQYLQNLTTFQSVEVVNPTKIATQIEIGEVIRFPIFCKCPNQAQLRNQVRYLISYVFQPSDNLSSIASRFNTTVQDIIDVNGNNSTASDTIFVPVSRLPLLSQIPTTFNSTPPASPVAPNEDDRKGEVIGLGIGLGICGLLLILVSGLWIHSRRNLKKRRMEFKDVEKQQQRQYHENRGGEKTLIMKDAAEASLLADVADYLDKYKVFGIEELKEATDDFDERLVIQGSVYKGTIGGELYAIKKMKWNAYEELKILQMVNFFFCSNFQSLFFLRVKDFANFKNPFMNYYFFTSKLTFLHLPTMFYHSQRRR